MNHYQILGLFVTCSVISGFSVAAIATTLNLSLFGALAVIYLGMFWMMLGMQKRARETSETKSARGRLRLDGFDKTSVSH